MKQFVKALDKDGDCFNYIAKTFPGLRMEKLKAGIYLQTDDKTLNSQTDARSNLYCYFTVASIIIVVAAKCFKKL